MLVDSVSPFAHKSPGLCRDPFRDQTLGSSYRCSRQYNKFSLLVALLLSRLQLHVIGLRPSGPLMPQYSH